VVQHKVDGIDKDVTQLCRTTGVDTNTTTSRPTRLQEDIMAEQSSQPGTYHPTLTMLREQLQGLLPERASAAPATRGAGRPGMVQMIMDNAPILMEVASQFMDRGRRVAEAVRPVPAPRRRGWRTTVLRPVVIAVAVAGAGYLISNSMRASKPGVVRG